MLLVQKYLENHTFSDLEKDHGVYSSFAKSGRKFSLNYDVIEAKENDPLAQECRGLILAPADGKPIPCRIDMQGKRHYENVGPGETVILGYGFNRFFNYGQGSAADVNFNDPKLSVQEKKDGTLIIVYYDHFIHQWCVATRSVPEADLLMENGLFTFRTLFEKAIQDTCGYSFNDLCLFLDVHHTYCFELCTPLNRIVVNHSTNDITLLAVRSLLDNQEISLDHPILNNLVHVPKVQTYTYSSIDELLDWVSSLNPLEHEGVVVRDSNFNRIKIKNAAYVIYNKLHDRLGTSERNCLELILLEKDDDVIPFMPEEIIKNLQKIKTGLQQLILKYDAMYQAAQASVELNDKKSFALLISQNKELWSAPFFNMFSGKSCNMKDFIQKNRKDGSWGDSFLDKILEMSKNIIK